jgi:ABC-type nitrate/sulfonate/bicarbonate transport system permease component
MNTAAGSRRESWIAIALIVALWELAGRMQWVGGGALPAPTEILRQAWADRADYPPHVLGTLRTSLIGFVLGNAIAIGFGLLFVLWRPAERLMAGINVTVFAMPAIALVPVLVIALHGDWPRIVLAALSVYYPTMVATVLGLTQLDPRLRDLVQVYGGREAALLRFVRWRSGLPTLLSGLRVAAPAAVLGSLLAEFGSGGSAGLGTYLIGSLGRADPARLWGIGLVATLISAFAYGAVGWVAQRVAGHTLPATTPVGQVPGPAPRRRAADVWIAVVAALLPIAFWWLIVLAFEAMGVSPVVLRDPAGVVEHLAFADDSAETLQRLADALWQTLPFAVVGTVIGLAFAFALALLGVLWRSLSDALLPVSLVTQSMPLVALAPLIVLVFGRDALGTLVITVSVTFFPAFVTMAQGLALVPQPLDDLVRAYGGSRAQWLRHVGVPWSLPYLGAAGRLAAPRAVLGVMIAEWLATGFGLGNLLNESRGMLDYGMIWSVAAVSVLAAIALHALAAALERFMLRRRALSTS